MTLDLLDAAFVARWRSVAAPPAPACRAGVEEMPCDRPADALAASAETAEPGNPPEQMSHAVPADAPTDAPTDAPLVERLLRAAPDEWLGLARHVERARHRGRRVIAVAGCERGEGRTTLVACLAAALRARGCEVTCVEPADAAGVGGAAHDKRIVLVDAGIWFPPGPVRRQWLMVASLGCEAAILVRRADRPGIGPRAALLAGLGIEVLGEVVTFTDTAVPSPADVTQPPVSLPPTSLPPTTIEPSRGATACETRA